MWAHPVFIAKCARERFCETQKNLNYIMTSMIFSMPYLFFSWERLRDCETKHSRPQLNLLIWKSKQKQTNQRRFDFCLIQSFFKLMWNSKKVFVVKSTQWQKNMYFTKLNKATSIIMKTQKLCNPPKCKERKILWKMAILTARPVSTFEN